MLLIFSDLIVNSSSSIKSTEVKKNRKMSSDPAKSPASQLLLALRAKKTAARRSAGATPSPSHSSVSASECPGVQPLRSSPAPGNTSRALEEEFENIKRERKSEEEEKLEEEKKLEERKAQNKLTPAKKDDSSSSLEEEFKDIKLERKTEEEEKLEERQIRAKLMLAREKLTRAKNQKEMLKELYATKKKDNVNLDWKDWTFQEMREEYVRYEVTVQLLSHARCNTDISDISRCYVKQADQEKKIYSNRKKLRESEYQVGELQWTLDNIRDEIKYLAPKSKSKLGMK